MKFRVRMVAYFESVEIEADSREEAFELAQLDLKDVAFVEGTVWDSGGIGQDFSYVTHEEATVLTNPNHVQQGA